MADRPRVIVEPPAASGGRRVRVDQESVGLAYGLGDLVEFLRRAGLEELDDHELRHGSGLVEWRGGGPDVWAAPA